MTDYIFRYTSLPSGMFMFMTASDLPSEMVVSHSGFLGCLLGACISVMIMSVTAPAPAPALAPGSCCVTVPFRQDGKHSERRQSMLWWIKWAVQVTFVVVTTIISLQMALTKFCKDAISDENKGWCSRSSSSIVPINIRWLVWFLSQQEETAYEGVSRLESLPRYAWLLYWVGILAISGPIAFFIARGLHNCKCSKRRKMLTVVARKFFHFVAVALFVPPTFYAPRMMSVSYAIAASLLVLVESLRAVANVDNVVVNHHDSDKKKEDSKKELTSTRIQQDGLGLNAFFETFFDEKDQCAVEGSFVVIHVALVVGCAIPLWLGRSAIDRQMHSIIPFMGIISLGVGDAAGAIIGSFFGQRRWPTSRRTIEGSVAMLSCMIACAWCFDQRFHSNHDSSSLYKDTLFVYLPLTILEAVTMQIDNLCLPLMGLRVRTVAKQ